MRAKSMVLIFIALVCGLVASIGISQVMDSSSGDGSGVTIETEEVYVAVADIDIDEQLSSENVKLEEWPAGRVPESAARTFEEIQGMYPNARLVQGEPILMKKLRTSHDSPVVDIQKGYRVVPIEVRRDTISQGLINPGDRVDIIGFFRRNGEIPQTTTRKILQNVRLFAVNSETERAVDEEGNQVNVQTVSLLIKDDQVNKLLLAVELGTLRMSLRRPDEETDAGVAAQEATIEDIFTDGTENGDEEDESLADTGDAPSILDLLGSSMPAMPTLDAPVFDEPVIAAAPAFSVIISGPNGTLRKFVWQDENGPAEEVFDTGFGGNPNGTEPTGDAVKTDTRPENSEESRQDGDESEDGLEEETEESPVDF